MDLENLCADYLRNITPIAQKIGEDLDKIKESYSDKWNDLTSKERNRILDENLIDPKVAKLYSDEAEPREYQYDYISHFSWFTKSQLNLFTIPEVKAQILSPQKRREAVISPRVGRDTVDNVKEAPTQAKSKISPKSPTEEKQFVELKSKCHPAKPKTPPPPPPSKLVPSKVIHVDDQDDIPKTGFDFLDNW